MYFLDNNSGTPTMPALKTAQSTTPLWFTEGDGSKGISWPGQDWFNIVQAELLAILAAAGIKPEKGKLNQLALAIKATIGTEALLQKNCFSEIAKAGKDAQQKARDNLGLGKLAIKDSLGPGDVDAWSKGESDKRFVKQTGDTMTGTLVVPRVQFPDVVQLDGNADLKRPDGFTLETLGDQSKNYPLTMGNLGNLITFKANIYRNVQFVIGSGNTEFWLRSLREDSPDTLKNWARVYTTQYKPTAADTQAADMRNNFAARMGIARVLSGASKPTSAGVWAVENCSWTPVAWGSLYVTTNQSDLSTTPGNQRFIHYLFVAHGRANKIYVGTDVNGSFSGWETYLPTAGGQISGVIKTSAEIQSTSSDNYRIAAGDYGTFWRNDGNSLYLLLTNAKDPYGTWNNLRPFSVNIKTGQVTFAHAVGMNSNLTINGAFRADKNISIGEDLWVDRNATVTGTLKVGNSTHASDGNILGSRWGNKWLWDAVIEQVNGRVDWGTFNREVGARATTDYVRGNFVQDVRFTAERQVGAGGVYDYRGGNTVLTGFTNRDGDYSPEGLFWSEIQIYKNGQWLTIGRG